ncbi:signal recognition particle, SRP19 subunit [Geopyxis carbonaria]|nr:signal recognition particle, SRP19 subunit [Geopyxis carbonaria]
MSRHARIEEVDDDPSESDISTLLTSQSAHPRTNPTLLDLDFDSGTPTSFSTAPRFPGFNPQARSSAAPAAAAGIPSQTAFLPASESAAYKSYQCLYPVYFDVNRSRAGGRKVAASQAVHNPLAREIVDACNALGLKTVFEPGKSHPKDWANPGRVRVQLKQDGAAVHKVLKNKFLLYNAIGEWLKAHPTTPQTPLKLQIPNVPFDGKIPEPPVVPRGWKMGSIVPLHSPALSGGGVTDDIFKEMMQGMGMPVGDAPGPSAGQIEGKKEKKDKKKGKK